MTTNTSEPSPDKEKGGIKQWIALFSIIFATFLEMLDHSVINVAIPKMTSLLNSTIDDMEWVVTGYTLATAVVIPLGGFLADRFGYKKILMLSVSAFIMTSAMCGMAWNDTSLIVFRVLQGLGGGIIMPVGMAMLYQIMDRSKVPIAMGIWGISAMAAPSLGPTIGGYVVEHMHWSILFYINIPIGLLSLLIAFFLIKETPKQSHLKFDFPGIILSSIFFCSLLLIIKKGEAEGWTSLYIVTLIWISVSSFMLLLWVETGKKDPVINLRLFKNKDFTVSILISSLVFIAIQGGAYILPIWYQNVGGLTPSQTGVQLMPQAIATALMMPLVGALSNRIGVIPFGVTGLALLTFGTYKLHFITGDISNYELNVYLVIRGLGIGLCMMPIIAAGLNTMSNELMGSASSLSNILRSVSSSFGIALLGTFMSHRTTQYGAAITEQISETSPAFAAFQGHIVHNYMMLGADTAASQGGFLGVLGQTIQKEALVRGFTDTFFLLVILGAICIPLVFLMKNKSSREGGDDIMIH
ncbi:DHA2 family efflux MFS transporter permease subunit [Paenibacillus naphthalenovorans]|uniref:DHA2 family efflux MFS transporter permease subunit n=1 Tax=Paenibacillus naphthalenovorans TaxID=162209 RepID=UPI0010B756BF|nr:DHA2 family efflux MFS transporter permease subunit [Paenibacillus naphthalenovorans]GCL70103.1 MFS transporter [Paenibacillus naphthalenovorans]